MDTYNNLRALLESLTTEERVSLLSATDWWRTPTILRDGAFVPHIKMSDGPNGARGESYVSGITAACFPCSTCVGATFDVDGARCLGQEIARETITKSANVLLAPTMNIIRSPLGGRNYETYSEDPYLIGTLASAFVNGCQSEGIAATPKHFVGNESEKRRTKMTSQIDEQTLREIYMMPFQLVMRDSDPWCFMTSYNRVNEEYCADSNRLLNEILRKEWGFSGVVVSDWLGTYSTSLAVKSGLDLEMPGPTRWRGEKLLKELQAGSVTIDDINNSAERVLELARKTGRFQNPAELPEKSVHDASRIEFIANLAAEGIVLLKNDGDVLPLQRDKTVAVIGQFATHPSIGGGGSAKVLAQHIISPQQGLEALGVKCLHSAGVPVYAALPHAEPDVVGPFSSVGEIKTNATTPVLLEWFNAKVVGERAVHTSAIASAEYMIKEAWPSYLDEDYCTRMSFTLTPKTSGNHVFSVITTGSATVFLDGVEVFHRPQEPVLQPESFYFFKAKIERHFSVSMVQGQTYRVELHAWAAAPEVLARVNGVTFQGASLRFKEFVDVPGAISAAARVAASSDSAIVFVGNTNEIESEGYDRESMDLTSDQYDLVSAVAKANPRTIVVNLSGSPVTVSPFIQKVPTFVQGWFAGQECGYSIARVLTGETNPSGRLPMSWPKRNEDNPAFANFPCDDNDILRYEEKLRVGYRYYDERDAPVPQFPFGFGLSYTTFALTGLEAARTRFGRPEDIRVELSVRLSNTGSRDGKTVVQIYVGYDGGKLDHPHQPRPVKELRAYRKVEVAHLGHEDVEFVLDKYAFSFFDTAAGSWKVQPGTYSIHAAFSAADVVQTVKLSLPPCDMPYWKGT
ncbi:glycoside hydrolase superfamily [Plectosphaerella plurivora]|uniref:beta-glucosidase n=1 Tax=Plectosphaerella plurivora TaxID=936078 RepID=A0A9P8UZQ1_9PEZI|nr:glycoside hydrolase superfamily [Plectosphaerella plurivora]